MSFEVVSVTLRSQKCDFCDEPWAAIDRFLQVDLHLCVAHHAKLMEKMNKLKEK